MPEQASVAANTGLGTKLHSHAMAVLGLIVLAATAWLDFDYVAGPKLAASVLLALILAVWLLRPEARTGFGRRALVAASLVVALGIGLNHPEPGSMDLLAALAAAAMLFLHGRAPAWAATPAVVAASALAVLGVLGLVQAAAWTGHGLGFISAAAQLLAGLIAASSVRAPDARRRGPWLCAATTIGIAVAMLAGALSGTGLVMGTRLLGALMPLPVALATLSLGVSLAWLLGRHWRVASALTIPAVLLSMQSLAEALGMASRGGFFGGAGAVAGSITPSAAIAVLLVAIGIVLAPAKVAWPPRWAPTWACGVVVVVIAALALVVAPFNLGVFPGWRQPAAMDPLTATTLLLLGLGLTLTASQQQRARLRSALWLPASAAAAVIVTPLLMVHALAPHARPLGGLAQAGLVQADPANALLMALALIIGGLLGGGLLAMTLRLAALARERAHAAETVSRELREQAQPRQPLNTAQSAGQQQIIDVLESVSDAVMMLDRDWKFVYLNPRAEALLRRRRRMLLGRSLWNIFPDAADGFRAAFERAQAEQVTASVEHYYAPLHAWFDVRAYPHPHGMAVYLRDVSEQRRREQALRERELLLEAAGRSARLGGWAIEVGGDRVVWTDEVCALHEVSAGTSPTIEEAIACYAPDSRELIRTRLDACVRHGAAWDEDLELVTSSGRRLWIRSIGNPAYGEDGRVVRVHGAFQDISDSKRAELLLRERAQQQSNALDNLRHIMDSAIEVICVSDEDGRFVAVNAASRLIWGYPPEDLLQAPVELVIHPDDIAVTRRAMAAVVAGEPNFDFRNRNITRDGRLIHMQWSASWSESTRQLCCIGRDRSAQERADRFDTGQRAILAAIAARQPLERSLLALVHLYQTQFPGARCALALLDDHALRCAAAPSLPETFVAGVYGRPIGPATGSGGAAAFSGSAVIVADIASDDRWGGLAELALHHALRAGWSVPVRASSGQVLATFDVYQATAREPDRCELDSLDGIAALAAIAIEQAGAVVRAQRNSLRLQRLAEAGVAINTSIGQQALHRQLVDLLREIIDTRMAVMSLFDGPRWQDAKARVEYSLSTRYLQSAPLRVLPDGSGIYALINETRQALRLTQAELEAHPRFRNFSGHAEQHPPLRGLLAVPLIGADERVLGVLMLSDKRDGEFDADDQSIALQFAQLAATALERSQLIDRLRERDRFFDMAQEMFCVYDPTALHFLQVNPAFFSLLGYDEQELLNRPATDFVHPDDRDSVTAISARMASDGGAVRNFVVRMIAADGSVCWLEWNGNSDGHGRYHAVARNISERRRIERERDFAASHDVATGLPRFPMLEVTLAELLDSGHPLAVFFIDLDHFHGINDSMGHAVGDHALRIIAERMDAVLGNEQRIARFAGDEFVAVVPELDAAQVLEIAQRLRAAVAEPIDGDGYRVTLTASVGISRAPEHGENAIELLRRAEAAMSRAKRQGRDGICEFSRERMQELEDRRLLGSRLRAAIDSGELTLAFQPRVRSVDQHLNGFEALARWTSPALGVIGPDRFIPTAEALGLMPELGSWVLSEACRQIRVWLEDGHRDFTVAVNMSAQQLQRPGLVEQVRAALAGQRIPPHMLELELTESSLMENVERVQSTLAGLKALGVSLALDDFGTGYSSLAYLKQFSLDKLKIDRSFVTDLPFDAHDVAIARTIVAIAHQLRMVVAAEGVENEAQASFLRDIGCDELQGYFFGRPQPAERAATLFSGVPALS